MMQCSMRKDWLHVNCIKNSTSGKRKKWFCNNCMFVAILALAMLLHITLCCF